MQLCCPSIRLSVCLSVSCVQASNSKAKKNIKKKNKNWYKLPQDRSNRCANFQLNVSKVRRTAA